MATCDPSALYASANCFEVLLEGQKESVELQLLCDISAALTAADLSSYFSAALEASKVLKATAGKLAMASMFNNNGSTRYLQVFDAAALPANGVVPDLVIAVTTGATVQIPLTGRVPFATGIVLAISTTAATLTIGAADALFSATYA